MTLLSTAQHIARDTRKNPRGHMVMIVVAAVLTVGAVALIAYLLWPTWGTRLATGPERLPVSVNGTLFNVPAAAIRRKIQRHSGPQERVDLSFVFPSLEAPESPKHVSADMVEESTSQPIDRIFLSISAHHDTLAPDMRVRTIYPRYLDQTATPIDDGLTMRAFRDGSPYANEDRSGSVAKSAMRSNWSTPRGWIWKRPRARRSASTAGSASARIAASAPNRRSPAR